MSNTLVKVAAIVSLIAPFGSICRTYYDKLSGNISKRHVYVLARSNLDGINRLLVVRLAVE